ncbi:MAG: hypothetical protein OHK0031_11570 [Anaerolineales bacterium]
MSRKKAQPDSSRSTRIVIQGDVSGNLIVGDKNEIDAAKARAPRAWLLPLTGLLLAAALLAVFWRFFPSSSSPRPSALSPSATFPPIPAEVWQIQVFDNLNLNGAPLFTFSQPAASNQEGGYQILLTPQALQQQTGVLPANGYSLRLAGEFEFQSGYFEFHCEHHDGCRVYVDGVNWIDAWWDGGGGHDLARDLPAGKHTVVIEFYDKSGYGLLEVRWRLKTGG